MHLLSSYISQIKYLNPFRQHKFGYYELKNMKSMYSSSTTKHHSAIVIDDSDSSMINAGHIIRSGGLVAFPTETVYGLGANALNATSCEKIFTTKSRPKSDPLIVHVTNINEALNLFDLEININNEIDDKNDIIKIIRSLGDKFWPGPLTLIYKANDKVPNIITAGTGFVGVRSPKHQVARRLIISAGVPIAAPSANRFGHVSPTHHQHVLDDLGNEDIHVISTTTSSSSPSTIIDMEDAICEHGIESTVCKVYSDGRLEILRAGPVTPSMIKEVVATLDIKRIPTVKVNTMQQNKNSENNEKDNENEKINLCKNKVENNQEVSIEGDKGEAQAPGQMTRHYAPDLPTAMTTAQTLRSLSDSFLSRCLILDYGGRLLNNHNDNYEEGEVDVRCRCCKYWDLSRRNDAKEACTNLFGKLRLAESKELKEVGVEMLLLPDLSDCSSSSSSSNSELELALWERIHRAASGKFVNKNEQF